MLIQYKMESVPEDLEFEQEFLIKIADFGFARIAPAEELMESYCGTPLNMAPEVI